LADSNCLTNTDFVRLAGVRQCIGGGLSGRSDGPIETAQFGGIQHVVAGDNGILYAADHSNSLIRVINRKKGIVSSIGKYQGPQRQACCADQ
jgi:hypothetical protein